MVSNLWLVFAALAFGLFAFFCGFAIGFRFSPTSLQRGTKPSDASQNGASGGGILTTGILECRILALVDEQVGYGNELSLAVVEAVSGLRVAYCHLTAHHTHKDEVEHMIELYDNHEIDNDKARRDCALQLVLRIATQYNLRRGRNILEELKMIMNCFIQRLSFISSEYGRLLNSTMDALWEFLQAEIKARDSLICESRPIWPISDDDMIVDDGIETIIPDPPVATPDQHLHTLAALQGTRQRALSTRNRQILM